ncbi:related to LCB2 - serine C-palmitoyltransferase subunit [Cephalotrichum gorgonifer]|uniref:Related to LCB2 - serine C-palmitoyltransferase subunit n=1 Tax=Cephalotrichum gorgonifer TaxID=2041049 RepID=A0AAE8SUQ7_9PEZI|nr:related to LCB2 - serine C-palmitoyltransferase subunit [Cephalotrichum gorgonifer]
MTSGPRSLEDTLAARLSSRQSHSRLRRLTTFPSTSIDFSSNSYLSLPLIPEVRRAYLAHIESYASSTPLVPLFGSGGSRLLDGNAPPAESLERDIAAFHHAPAGLLFNSGFDANVGFFSCVPQPGDIIVYDELIHASIHDGMRLSRAGRKLAFRHNSVGPDVGSDEHVAGLKCLDGVLSKLLNGEGGEDVRDGKKSVFVAVEGVYSMDGDVAALAEIVACVKRLLPNGNGHVIVDEAHSTGLFGKQGRGLVCELGLEDSVFARLHTFGKAMGSYGAIMLCSAITREYLINYARPLIYTTAMPLSCLASIKVAYDFLASNQADDLRSHLRELTGYTHDLLLSVTSRLQDAPELLYVDPGVPRSPIIPLLTPLARSLAQHCQERGLILRPIVAPTVPKGKERVRICLHAANTRAQIEELARAVEEWVRLQGASASGESKNKSRL